MRNPLPCLHRQVVDGLPAESGCWSGRDGWVDLGARRLTTKGTKDAKEEAAKSIQSNAACHYPCFQLRAHSVLRGQHPVARVKIPPQEFGGEGLEAPKTGNEAESFAGTVSRSGGRQSSCCRLTTKGTKDTKEEAAKSIQSNAACRDPSFQLRAHRVLRGQHPEARVKIPPQVFGGEGLDAPKTGNEAESFSDPESGRARELASVHRTVNSTGGSSTACLQPSKSSTSKWTRYLPVGSSPTLNGTYR